MLTLTLKHWFVPHHGNRHQPRILRISSLSVISLLLVLTQLVYNFSVTGQWRVLAYATNISQPAVVDLTNQERTKAGQAPLKESRLLDEAARLKAEDMFKNNYWNHVSPEGTQPWYFFDKAGYVYAYAGENLARNFDTSAGVIAGWMNSPGHKENLLNPNYTDVGIAVVDGILLGKKTTLVVAHYGSPLKEVVLQNNPSSNPTLQKLSLNETDLANTEKLAPSPRNYSMVKPLFFSGTMGWGQVVTLFTTGSLVPVYVATHVKMLKRKLNLATRWLWRRRLFELVTLLGIIGHLIRSGWGSVG